MQSDSEKMCRVRYISNAFQVKESSDLDTNLSDTHILPVKVWSSVSPGAAVVVKWMSNQLYNEHCTFLWLLMLLLSIMLLHFPFLPRNVWFLYSVSGMFTISFFFERTPFSINSFLIVPLKFYVEVTLCALRPFVLILCQLENLMNCLCSNIITES